MSHLDTYERMVTDRVRNEMRAEVRAILDPLVKRADAAIERGDRTVRMSSVELAMLEWAWSSTYPVNGLNRSSVARFNGLEVEVTP